MMIRLLTSIATVLTAFSSVLVAQDFNAVRDDQFNRLKNYAIDAILPSGLVRDSLVLDPNASSFHPATPDAAGFDLVALAALNHVGKLPDAEQRVISILSAYAGQTAGVVPDRSADGYFTHFMNISTGAQAGGGWDASYSPIGTALLVAGAQFARNQFPNNGTIASLTQQLTNSVNFNNAIDPSLNGGIYLDMTKAGGGGGGEVHPFNEYALVESLALREANNQRALAVKHLWFDSDFLTKRSYVGYSTLTDNPGSYAPAFWVQDMHFFSGDFRLKPELEAYFTSQQQADKAYSSMALGQSYRYGITAGVSPNGYEANRIGSDPSLVFSPEAVAAWGDMTTLVSFYNEQIPTSDPRYRYGMVRVSAQQPSWIPFDAGLVDHMFLLFGLVESIDPSFFTERMLPALAPCDYNADGIVNQADYSYWRSNFGSLNRLAADGNNSNQIDAADYVIWRKNAGGDGLGSSASVPEPGVVVSTLWVFGIYMCSTFRSGREGGSARSATCEKTYKTGTESACSACSRWIEC
jgi:hypothetical protein